MSKTIHKQKKQQFSLPYSPEAYRTLNGKSFEKATLEKLWKMSAHKI